MAYLRIHPIDPGLELMLAQLAHVTARCAGEKPEATDFFINTVNEPEAEPAEGDEFAAFLRARANRKG